MNGRVSALCKAGVQPTRRKEKAVPRLVGAAGPVSGHVAQALRTSGLPPSASILDVPSGFGRHAIWLSNRGYSVTAVDIDEARLRTFKGTLCPARDSRLTHCVVANAENDLPFSPSTFDAAIVIHFVSKGLIRRIAPLLRPQGVIIYQSYGAQGENWRGLPQPGGLADELAYEFDVLEYLERPVGPVGEQAVVVKFLARRR